MAELVDRQWELDGSLKMGRLTPYIVGPPDIGEAESRGDSVPRPRADGQVWGRGYRGGRTWTLDITVNTQTPAAASDAASLLEAAWDAESVRSQPGALSVLRYSWAGRTRRVYGRTGKIAPTDTSMDYAGRIDYQAEFTTTDHRFYGDDLDTVVVPFIPTSLGGLVGGLVGGWQATSQGVASGVLHVDGAMPAWLPWTVHGPIVNPTIEVTGRWSATLEVSLAYDQAITVDPSPWNRRVYRVSDGANFAGAFTAGSMRLSGMTVPPGASQVLLRGVDPTGSSYLTTSVRPVWASY